MSVDEQVRHAGERLADVPIEVPDFGQLLSRRTRHRGRVLTAASVVVVVAGVVGLWSIRTRDDSTPSAPSVDLVAPTSPPTTAASVPTSAPGQADATAVATYDLSITGAELITDDSFTVTNADGAIWVNVRFNIYLSLMVRAGLGTTQPTPTGLGPMTELTDIPGGLGRVWITDVDPSNATSAFSRQLWWTRGDDVWFVTLYTNPTTEADVVSQELRNWALEITTSGDGVQRTYALDDPDMHLVATDNAGELRTRTRVWTLDGHDITLLATEHAEASGRRNLLSAGPFADTEIAGLHGLTAGPTETGDIKVGWPIDSATETWADLTIPAGLADRTDEILAALGPIGQPSASPTNTVIATFERIEFAQSFDPECDDPLGDGWPTSEIVATADPAGQTWRTDFTYPDGTTRSLIAFDDPWNPTRTERAGNLLKSAMGCTFTGASDIIMSAEPGQGSFYSLNPMDAVPPPVRIDPNGPSAPAVLTYLDLGVKQAGLHPDSRGRQAELWVQQITGFGGPDNTAPLTQTQKWFIDPVTGQIVEQTYEQHIDGIGTAQWSATLVESGTAALPAIAMRDPAVTVNLD